MFLITHFAEPQCVYNSLKVWKTLGKLQANYSEDIKNYLPENHNFALTG